MKKKWGGGERGRIEGGGGGGGVAFLWLILEAGLSSSLGWLPDNVIWGNFPSRKWTKKLDCDGRRNDTGKRRRKRRRIRSRGEI